MKLENLTILQLHEMYVNNETTPFEVVSELIELIKKDNNNFMEQDNFKNALEEAKNLGEVEVDNLLWGIPYLAKDNIATKDTISSASSFLLNNYVSPFDAEVIRRLKNKKAILLGKTTMDEFALGGKGLTGHKGVTYNPYDKTKTYIAGGSSCGSAAAVGARLIPFALGSDTGDSIRKPASFTNTVGFKPTWSTISRYGLFTFAPSLDHVGYFTNSVLDAAILFDNLAGRDEKDATSSNKKLGKTATNVTKTASKYRVAVIKEIVDRIEDKEYLALFNNSIQKMKEAGHDVQYVDVPLYLLEAIFPTYYILSCAEASSNTACYDGVNFGTRVDGDDYEAIINNTRTRGFSYEIKKRLVFGAYALSKQNAKDVYFKAQRARNYIVKSINNILNEFDFIYLPASPSHATKIGEVNTDPDYTIIDNHLAIGNFGGYPSITLPLGFVENLPVGVNFTGRPFDEEHLLNFAYLFEQNYKGDH
jgi:aspartyl-tRNA(Asn)/glutamyl-tRNA(Gln) amidotransferase subunit A